MKAVIYARYSSDSQREESIEGQLRECTAFAEKNGMTVLRHYIDRAAAPPFPPRSSILSGRMGYKQKQSEPHLPDGRWVRMIGAL